MEKSKRVHITDISHLEADSTKLPPFLIHFKHAKANPQGMIESKPEVKVDLVSRARQKPDFKMELKTSNLAYETSEDRKEEYFDYYIAIRDKATGKTRLVEALNMVLKPKVTPPASKNPVLLAAAEAGETDADSKEAKTETNKLLIKKFGQKKGQNYYANKEKLAVDENDTQERVKMAVGEVDEQDIVTVKPEAGASMAASLIPPRDETAQKPSDIYRVEHLLTEREVEDCVAAFENFKETYNTPELIDEGVKNKLIQPIGGYFLKQLISKESADTSCALVLYLDTLVKFIRLKPFDLAKGFKCLPDHLPVSLKRKVFDNFSSGLPQRKIITPELKDKAICHVIILSLMINGCKTDVKLLTESIRVEPRNMKKLVAITGAHLESDPELGQQRIILRKNLASFDLSYISRKRK
eukprot:TRINITY_DN1254_c0_g1_i10.p1 TRINITY_DN1254_c0_g1~~TRINITY_DN1254_c0_g1_i10.p1  ORF type:complete len:412 (-),score=76.42 TRINITY_DN1254_c0_g1_i10:72-1307(-)